MALKSSLWRLIKTWPHAGSGRRNLCGALYGQLSLPRSLGNIEGKALIPAAQLFLRAEIVNYGPRKLWPPCFRRVAQRSCCTKRKNFFLAVRHRESIFTAPISRKPCRKRDTFTTFWENSGRWTTFRNVFTSRGVSGFGEVSPEIDVRLINFNYWLRDARLLVVWRELCLGIDDCGRGRGSGIRMVTRNP